MDPDDEEEDEDDWNGDSITSGPRPGRFDDTIDDPESPMSLGMRGMRSRCSVLGASDAVRAGARELDERSRVLAVIGTPDAISSAFAAATIDG